ncbi:MAG: TonB-dependent receptor [Candidatus Adiutrix sp.]|nr:TonB-dependent receptor [Candidatus Adiutrix sp.]
MFIRIMLLAAMALALLSSAPAWAQNQAGKGQTDNEENAENSGTEVALPTVEVRAAVRREELQSTSATVLENKDVVGRVYRQPLDMILMSPGVSITQYGESGIAPEFQIRGSKAGHGGAEVTMYLDGIPLHDNGHANAYLDTGIIIPIEIETVEIIKGPSSVYYGQRAGGGALPMQTIKGGNFTRLNLRYGSYNEMDAQGLLARETDQLSQVYAFQAFHSDGYRDHSEWDKKNFSGRWTYRFNDKFSTSLNLRAYQAQWNSAGYIPKRLNLPPTAAVDDGSGEYNGGKRARYDGRLWANYFINDKSQLTFYLYGSTLEHTRWQMAAYPANATGPGTGTGGNGTEQYNTHESWGAGLSYNYNGDWAGRPATVTLGTTYSFEQESPRQTWQLPWGSGHRRGNKTSDTNFSVTNPAFLGEVTYQVLDPLNLRLGGRYDILGGKFRNNLAGTPEESAPRKTFFSPKAGFVWSTPVDWLSVYGNFGRGFSMPGLSNATFYEGGIYDLTTRDQYELGYRAAPLDWLNLEMTYFWAFTKNDVTYDEQTNSQAPIGETTRQGLEVALNIYPARDWTLKANYSYIDAKQKVNGTAAVDNSGRRITAVPRHISNAELSYEPEEGLGGRVSFRWEADSLLRDPPPTLRDGTPNLSGGYQQTPYKAQDKGTLDMQLSYRFNANYKVVLDVLNVLDKEYYGSQGAPAYGTGDFTYSIQPPRTFYVGLEMNWE